MMNVIVNMKASECEKTGFVAHICRNKLWYGIGLGVVLLSSGTATWYFYCRKSQDLRNAIFSKLNISDADFITFLSNTNLTGVDKEAKKFYSKFFTVSGSDVNAVAEATVVDFVKGLDGFYNDKVPTNTWYNLIKGKSDRAAIIAALSASNGQDFATIRLNKLV